jgi:hypothetical protein
MLLETATSRAYFMRRLMAAQAGMSGENIALKLMELSSKAKDNGENYTQLAENAPAAAARQLNRCVKWTT